MKCKQCGQDFPNLNALTQHKKVCGKEVHTSNAAVQDTDLSEVFFAEKTDTPIPKPPVADPFLVPLELCPPEIKYYALGHTVGLRLVGKYTAAGVIVQEVKLIR